MELKELSEKVMNLFDVEDIKDLGSGLINCVFSNDFKKYEEFENLVKDLSTDWLQKIYQYYQANRKEKMQDYTPKSLAKFMGMIVGDAEYIIDMCAGSGALTIQKWNLNHDQKFKLYEYDENVMPYLLFNMAVRNINCYICRADVLQGEIYKIYKVIQGENYATVKEIPHGSID